MKALTRNFIKEGLNMDNEQYVEQIRADSQSLAYGSDVATALLEEFPLMSDRHFSLLDVGPRTATGTNLIAQIFHPISWTRLKAKVTAIDLEPEFAERARAAFPDVDYQVGDIFQHEVKYDIVTCSHTIEHVPDPGQFFSRLKYLAKQVVVLAGPYNEPADRRIPGHINSIGDEFFTYNTPTRLKIYKSPHWHNGDCFIAVYRLV
jgi:2-polyprenyl-3-methyl-5-hydroxy-6-metoxy-1,4-benzoquinol methylase